VKFKQMDFSGRQSRLRTALGQHRLDGLLITHLPNIRYLCGFTGSAGLLFISQTTTVFFSDGRYRAQAESEVEASHIVIARKSVLAAVGDWFRGNHSRHRLRRIGFETEHMSVAERKRLGMTLPSALQLREAPPLVEQARQVKGSREIHAIRSAVDLGASLFQHMLRNIRPGVRENEVAAKLEFAARKAGAEAMSFETIIASGPRSALPHGRASAAAIPARGFVVCDFGVILAGYCSDMTRTLYVGHPTAQARAFYEAVQEAQYSAIQAVLPGVSLAEVDRAARKILQKRGLGRYFTHSTGHGVGLEIHEWPRVAAGQKETLLPGMVITIEPGAYIPGKWGVRIEDMVLVTERACEVLTPTTKALIAV
jgi:Xaa-Pro aminopeptidase